MSSFRRGAAAGALLSLCLALSACGGTAAAPGGATPSSSASSTASASASTSSSDANAVVIDIIIANRQVKPSGEKLNLSRGQTVIMHVTSDMDDEVHAHTGGDGYELEVSAGKPATGSFVVSDPGSFEIESHHLNKIIAILNVR